ncbi:uncharacterized protein LOC142176753 [Nicotiana tabacum]|uniref:Uncharacterized protein LOC142176753 n=1 Tax=Nicotiana tabacum TaxID=4097 RepID=A0AC58TV89_TOBAC
MLQNLKDNLVQAQARMKFYADQNRTNRSLNEGDLVYLKLQPYRQASMAMRKNLKLCAKYYGPYTVLKKVGLVAYQLDLPHGSQIHPVFHISQLKRRVGPAIVPNQQPLVCDSDGRVLVQPLAILKRRMVKFNNAATVKVLVQWTNLSEEEATWEDWGYIKVFGILDREVEKLFDVITTNGKEGNNLV